MKENDKEVVIHDNEKEKKKNIRTLCIIVHHCVYMYWKISHFYASTNAYVTRRQDNNHYGNHNAATTRQENDHYVYHNAETVRQKNDHYVYPNVVMVVIPKHMSDINNYQRMLVRQERDSGGV